MPKIPKSPRKCIFCGGTRMSKEHVFARWMRDYLPPGEGGQQVFEGDFETGAISTGHGTLNREGDLRSQKLKVVCEACNNVWMSKLQNLTKPVLLPLIKGESQVIRSADVEILAVWASMFAFVYETTAPNYPIKPNVERARFMDSKLPPNYWMYWCGRFDGQTSPAFHRGIFPAPEKIGPELLAETGGDEPRMHLTLLGAGKICFAIFGCNSLSRFNHHAGLVELIVTRPGIMMSPTSLGGASGFFPLWPPRGTDIDFAAFPTPPLTAMSLQSIGNEFAYAFEQMHREARAAS